MIEDTGQRVVALCGTGGYAEYVAADEATTFPIPDGVERRRGAGAAAPGPHRLAPVPDVGQLAEGETVVVHAAAGGVGSLAVQLGRRWAPAA